jgi:subtilisin family serine protease
LFATLSAVRRLLRLLVACLLVLAPTAASAATNDPLRSHQWGLDTIHADEAHAATIGVGAVVAVVDTGIDASHQDLQGRVLPGYDFVENDATPQDGQGHGTHVAGIIAADADNGVGVDSVAPGAKILPIRVLNDSGSGTSAVVAAGIDWATTHGANVINLSLSGAVPLGAVGQQRDIDAAIGRALARGVVVVAAAGNDSLPLCQNNPFGGQVLCVGAVDRRGARSFYSSFGDGLSLVAPGGSSLPGTDEDILSTWRDGDYKALAGTSQATPQVSGVAALLAALGVRGQAAVQRILATATNAGPAAQYGAGIVNAAGAVSGLARPAAVTFRGRQRIRAVLRHGIRISCEASCTLIAQAKGTTIARGARLTRAGKRILKRALRQHRTLRATVTVTIQGAKLTRKLRLVP